MGGSDVDRGPIVSVIIPVWNVEPYLRECLDSVVGQSIGVDRLQIVAVDDGSTDGSGAILDEYATRYPQLSAIHEPNSGGPGRPRNVGLDHATGRYVFFLDADDYLGSEALERLVAMAERNGSDIVLGKMVGVAGRLVPGRWVFQRSLERASVPEVYGTGSVLKLFRRALIERLGLRFEEGLPGGEDGPFTARAYLEAGVISVVADYDCYYCRLRIGSQTHRADRQDDLVEKVRRIETQRMELVARYRKPGIDRDALMIKHIGQIMRPFRRKWLALEPDEQRRLFEVTAAIIRRWQTPRIARALPPWLAIKTYCLEHGLMDELADIVACPARTAYGNPIVVGRRVFARYPHFRDASKIPDRCFEITDRIGLRAHVSDVDVVDGTLLVSGHAYLSLLGGSTSLVLQRWPSGPRLEFTTERVATPGLRDHQVAYRRAGFAFAVDLSTAADGRRLPSGTWRILLSVRAGEVSRTAPLRATDVARAARPERGAARAVARGRAALYLSGSRDVRLRVGRVGRIARWAEAVETAYARLMRRAVTPLLASRWGRLGTLVVAKVRPGSIGRPDE